MIKDFQTYINEGLFDRNQSEFSIIKTDRGIEQVYFPKTKEELYSYIDIDIEKSKRDRTYPNVNLNNIDISELEDDALGGLFSDKIYTINPDISDWNIKSMPSNFFKNNEQIEEFTIPNSVTSIGYRTFWGCSSLTSVTIPNSVTSIGDSAFEHCSGLTKTNYTGDIAGWCGINFGHYSSNPTAYSHTLYINGVEVKDLVIPNSVTSIGGWAFSGCSGLTSITIGISVTSIGRSAFYYCSILTSVTIPNSVTSIGDGAFEHCSGLTSVTIPNSVTSIGEGAFWGCSGLTSVTIPNSVTSIGDRTFWGCSGLTSVTIPNSVTRIGEDVFYGCRDLKDVTISKNCRIYMCSFPENCKITRRDD